MRKRAWWWLLCALLLGACGALPRPAPTEAPVPAPVPDTPVPAATLRTDDGAAQVGVPGTRCWDGLCLDMVGPLAPPDALVVAPDEPLTFELTAGDPSSVSLRVLQWQASPMRGPEGAVVVDMEAPLVASGKLDTARTIPWQAPSEPGEYALSLFSAYQQGGDISYGWHIVVE